MNPILIVLSVLSVWRATHLLQEEEGPLGIFSMIQAWFARKPDMVGGLNRGFFCFYCLSIWVSIPFALIQSTSLMNFILLTLSFSAGAVIINDMKQ